MRLKPQLSDYESLAKPRSRGAACTAKSDIEDCADLGPGKSVRASEEESTSQVQARSATRLVSEGEDKRRSEVREDRVVSFASSGLLHLSHTFPGGCATASLAPGYHLSRPWRS